RPVPGPRARGPPSRPRRRRPPGRSPQPAPRRRARRPRAARARTRRETASSPRDRPSRAFLEGEDAVRGEIAPFLLEAAGPAHVQPLYRGGRGQTEVYTQVVLRRVAAPAPHLLGLDRAARGAAHAGADRAPVRARAHELEGQPVVAGTGPGLEEVGR